MSVSGAYAYVADSGAGLRVIDVSEPAAPAEVGLLDTPGFAGGVAVAGGSAYVADYYSLRVIDVSPPAAPAEVGSFATPWSSGVTLSDGHVLVIDGYLGVFVFAEFAGGASPDARECFIPAAAVAAGAQGAFFQTDVEINNSGTEESQVFFQWLPRGEDNSVPAESEPIALAAGQSLPAIRATEMIQGTEPQRIIFLSENDDVRANVGCQNGSEQTVRVFIELFNSAGESFETKTMDLAPWSNNQITRVFRNYSPVEAGYVDVWTNTEGASIYCYGSVLDNLTSDPTTVLPQ